MSEQEHDNVEPPPDGVEDEPQLNPAEEAALEEAAERSDQAAPADDPGPDTEHQAPNSEPQAPSSAPLPPEVLALCKAAVEAMLFSSSDPITAKRLAAPIADTGIDTRGVRRLLKELGCEYDEAGRGFRIEEIAGGFQVLTRPEYAEYIAELRGGGGGGRLSQAALETLAVVAYKQPVTRADIEAIRGVQAGPLLRALLQKGLVKISGRAEVIGRPLLYATTKRFLEHFGLKSLNELPKVEELPSP